jgi:HSP20 family protein
LPGVDKNDIQLNGADKVLTIKVDTPERKYYKEVELPEEVESEGAKATYKNGVLEVVLNKKKAKPKGVSIKIE